MICFLLHLLKDSKIYKIISLQIIRYAANIYTDLIFMTCLQSILTCIFDTCIFVFLAESDSKEECQLLKKFRKLFGIKDVKQQIVCLKEVKTIFKSIVCLFVHISMEFLSQPYTIKIAISAKYLCIFCNSSNCIN